MTDQHDITLILREVTEADAYAEPWTFRQHCHRAADEIEVLRGHVADMANALTIIAEWAETASPSEAALGTIKTAAIARVALKGKESANAEPL